MKKATISETKNKLSYYLNFVKKGETVLILERNNPIATITPFVGDSKETEIDLISKGIIRPPQKKGRLPKNFFSESPAKASASVLEVLLNERSESR